MTGIAHGGQRQPGRHGGQPDRSAAGRAREQRRPDADARAARGQPGARRRRTTARRPRATPISAAPASRRIRDAADADTTPTVDIGAFEADPSIEDIADKSDERGHAAGLSRSTSATAPTRFRFDHGHVEQHRRWCRTRTRSSATATPSHAHADAHAGREPVRHDDDHGHGDEDASPATPLEHVGHVRADGERGQRSADARRDRRSGGDFGERRRADGESDRHQRGWRRDGQTLTVTATSNNTAVDSGPDGDLHEPEQPRAR